MEIYLAPEFGKSLGENGLLDSTRGLKYELSSAFLIVSSPNKCFLSAFLYVWPWSCTLKS